MLAEDLLQRCHAIRKAYRELELKNHDKEWSIEEDLLALTNDIGNMNRLIMTKQGRYYDDPPYQLEQKLVENIWWLVSLADRLAVDLQQEMETFLTQKEELLGIKNKN